LTSGSNPEDPKKGISGRILGRSEDHKKGVWRPLSGGMAARTEEPTEKRGITDVKQGCWRIRRRDSRTRKLTRSRDLIQINNPVPRNGRDGRSRG
jgi:hypothetical protein